MFGSLKRMLGSRRSASTSHWCRPGKHGRLVTGLGAMGDAIVCLDCGREKYEEHWAPKEIARAEMINDSLRAEVMAARELPGGINARINEPDPEFDRWLKSGPNGHVWTDSQKDFD